MDKALEEEIRKFVADEVEAKTQETMIEFINDLEGACAKARSFFSERKGLATIRETAFNILTWQPKKGAKLADFEIATKDANDQEKFQHALNILKTNNATINERFYEPQFQHTYWVFQETIYRQLRAEKQ
jgi:hypothetical protein